MFCKFCLKEFKDRKSLKSHLALNKKCSLLFKDNFLWLDSIKDQKIDHVCRFCQRTFSTLNSMSSHIKSNKDCYKLFKLEKDLLQKEYDDKNKVVCMLCGKKLRNISNTHLKKHNITQQDYKNMFENAQIFSDGLLDLQRDNREKTMHLRYTEEEIRYLKGQKSMEARLKNDPNLENYKSFCKARGLTERYRLHMRSVMQKVAKTEYFKEAMRVAGLKRSDYWKKLRKEDEEKYFSIRKDITEKRKETCIKLYGVPFAQSLPQAKFKQKQSLIKKYGSLENAYREVSKKSVDTRLKRGILNFCPIYSLESQILFQAIEKELLDFNFTLFYATNSVDLKSTNEFRVRVESNTCLLRFLDFYIKELNLAIEFDEDHHLTDKNIKLDLIREDEIKNAIPNIKILHIAKKEFLSDFDKTLNKCLNFIFDNV